MRNKRRYRKFLDAGNKKKTLNTNISYKCGQMDKPTQENIIYTREKIRGKRLTKKDTEEIKTTERTEKIKIQ